MKIKAILVSLMIGQLGIARNDRWHISTSSADNYTGIAVANGRPGILPSKKPLETKQIILNNVCDKESPLGVRQILQGMKFRY